MNSYIIKKKIAMIIIFVIVMSQYSFSSVISDYDGSAFVPKSEFEELKEELNTQIDRYSKSIDNKVDGMIANYIAALRVSNINITSTLNSFSKDRRTFYNIINNPTASGQDDLYISTAGLWTWSQPTPYAKENYWDFIDGYSFAGLNNYAPPGYGGHQKWLVELNNGKSGKYIFTDKKKLQKKDGSEEEIQYINDEYRKNLKYKIVSTGVQVSDAGSDLDQGRSLAIGPGKTTNDLPEYGGPTSISWTNTYNWSGKNERSAGAGKVVDAQEALMLVIENDDYDSSKAGVNPMDWVNGLSGSTIFTAETGCLTKDNQYYWNKRITNFNIGNTAQQAVFCRMYGTYSKNGVTEYSRSRNSYNSSGNTIPLAFNVPTITKLEGNKIAVLDVSNKIAEPSYYFSGIPLCDVPKDASTLTIKLKATINKLITTAGDSGLSIALKAGQFRNVGIGSETPSDLIYNNSWTSTTLPNDDIVITFDEDVLVDARDKTLWLKGIASNANCSVTFESTNIYYTN